MKAPWLYMITSIFIMTQPFLARANLSNEEILVSEEKHSIKNLDPLPNLPLLQKDISLLESEEIVYTASKKLEAIRTAPNALSVITSSHIRSLGAMYIPQIMKLFPGIDVAQLTRFEYTVGLRGFINSANFRPRDILVLVDGRTIYDDFSGNVEWETLDIFPQDIAKIEVIRGASSAIHGANGNRGVVNIMTRPPIAVPTFEYDATLLNDGFRQQIAGSAVSGPYSWKITGGYEDIEIWDRFGQEVIRGENSANTWRVNTAVKKSLTNGGEITISGGSNTGIILQHTTSGFLVENHQSNNHVQFDYESQKISGRFFWNNRDLESKGPSSGRTLTTRYQNMYDIEVIKRFVDFGKNDFSLGGQFRFTDVNSTSTPGENNLTTSGIFFDEKYNWSEDILLHISGRGDHHDEVGYTFSPRVGISYMINPDHTVKASINEGRRNPTFSQNFFNISIGPASLVGNKDLKPEKSRWYEIGYNGKSGDKLKSGVDIFHVTMTDVITSVDNGPIVTFINSPDKTKGYGGELWGQYMISSQLRIISNYAYAYYEINSKKLGGTTPHKFNLGVLFDQWQRLTGAVTFHLVRSTTPPFSVGGTPGAESVDNNYETVNLFLGYNVTQSFRLRLDAVNITNSKHRDLSPIGEELSADIRLTLTYIN